MSYTQGGEEAVILDIFKDKPTGVLLDIGAADGKTFSNSLALIERGWSGTLIEPSLKSFQELFALHKDNPRVTLVNACVGIYTGLVEFHYTEDLVSTTDEAHLARWKDAVSYLGSYWVFQIGIDSLLDRCRKSWDFVSIDVEGSSAELAIAASWAEFASVPTCYCIEHDNQQERLRHKFGSDYETAYEDGNNLILKRKH
jgi:FkbM family methyltransferase